MMSAPELPPIVTNGKKTGLLVNGFSRSKTFYSNNNAKNSNNNVLQDPRFVKRNSVHSDSSLQRYRINTESRTSSSSSQASRGRVLSAGTDRRMHRQVLAPELPKDLFVPSCEFYQSFERKL